MPENLGDAEDWDGHRTNNSGSPSLVLIYLLRHLQLREEQKFSTDLHYPGR